MGSLNNTAILNVANESSNQDFSSLPDGVAKLFGYSKGVQEKKQELQKLVKHLKKGFRGIDDVIQEIARLMEPWRIMSEGQIRPIIINLWGMTGTGKTSLVREIAAFLKVPIIQEDLGEYTDRKNFSSDFYHKFGEFSGKDPIILLDEIQNPRTINDSGDEVDREGLRGFWSLLSDGKIVPDERISKGYYEGRLLDAIDSFQRHGGVNPNADKTKAPIPIKIALGDGRIIDAAKLAQLIKDKEDESGEEEEIFEQVLLDDDDDDDLESDDLEEGDDDSDDSNPPWHLASWLIDSILELCNKPITRLKVQEMLRDNWLETSLLLLDMLDRLDVQPVLDYRRAIIFITGNVDEVYTAAHINNPDVTPDQLHAWSKKITVPMVKQALLRRFRPEQVARLGNNHILYPAFDAKTFRQIIKLDLERISKFILERYDVKLKYDKSVSDLIFKEGVFPTQGARPVLTTVASLVESSVPECLSSLVVKYENGLPAPVQILVTMDPQKETISFFEEGGELLVEAQIPLSIDVLRRPKYDDSHINIAFHEAGHALCHMMVSGKIPHKVCAFSPNVDSMGYMEEKTDLNSLETKKSMVGDICSLLGGWAAEKVVFGDMFEELRSSGCGSDIKRATMAAIALHQKLGLSSAGPIKLIKETETEEEGITLSQEDETIIRSLVEEQKERALHIVTSNQQLLLDMARNLLVMPSLESKDIQALLKANGVSLPVFKTQTSIFEGKMKEAGMKWGDDLLVEKGLLKENV